LLVGAGRACDICFSIFGLHAIAPYLALDFYCAMQKPIPKIVEPGEYMGYFYLSIAIIAEVVGTSALKASQEFTKIGPSLTAIVGYGASLYFLSLVLKTIPVGIAYAIWSGIGVTLITVIGAVLYKQVPDIPAMIGMTMIMSGVAIINVFSKAVSH
jgi:small multidrug resistance pump